MWVYSQPFLFYGVFNTRVIVDAALVVFVYCGHAGFASTCRCTRVVFLGLLEHTAGAVSEGEQQQYLPSSGIDLCVSCRLRDAIPAFKRATFSGAIRLSSGGAPQSAFAYVMLRAETRREERPAPERVPEPPPPTPSFSPLSKGPE